MKSLIKLFKRLFSKRKVEQPKVETDPYAPRVKNRIYPNDKYAQYQINKWLDDVLDKHHG